MPHYVAYGCTRKVRAAVQTKGEKISYHKVPEDKVVRKSRSVRKHDYQNVTSKLFSKLAFKGFLSAFYTRIVSEIS